MKRQGRYLILGVAIGCGIGVALDDIPTYLALGIAIGLLIELRLRRRHK